VCVTWCRGGVRALKGCQVKCACLLIRCQVMCVCVCEVV